MAKKSKKSRADSQEKSKRGEQAKLLEDKPVNYLENTKLWLADTGKQLIIAVILVFTFRSAIIEPYKIPSGSMIPTLFVGDHIFVNKFAYGWKIPFTEFLDEQIYITEPKVPARGDVIVFRYPLDELINYIKRVIGLPGDTIAVRNNILFVNESPVSTELIQDAEMMEGIGSGEQQQNYSLFMAQMQDVKHPIILDNFEFSSGSNFQSTKIPEGHVFVLGDNRNHSEDSRYWGFVPLVNVKGKALFIWLNIQIFNRRGNFDFQFKPFRIGKSID